MPGQAVLQDLERHERALRRVDPARDDRDVGRTIWQWDGERAGAIVLLADVDKGVPRAPEPNLLDMSAPRNDRRLDTGRSDGVTGHIATRRDRSVERGRLGAN